MAQYNRNNYAYDNYNPNMRTQNINGSAAPKMKPAPQKKPKLELVKKTRKTAAQVRQQTEAETKRIIRTICVAMTILMFMAVAIFSRVQLDEVNRKIAAVENDIKLAQSDEIRIRNELNALVSIDNVEDFAANQLGMVKVQDYQVIYIDLSTDDYVSKVNGKATDKVINKD